MKIEEKIKNKYLYSKKNNIFKFFYFYYQFLKSKTAIFLGKYTPEAIGDYIAGPNHVLPTEGTARFSSGLGTNDFLRRTTFVQCNEHNLNDLGKHAEILAEAEGLDAHRMSIYARRKDD